MFDRVAWRVCGILLASALLIAATVAAQGIPLGTPHSVTLAWTAPSPVGGSGTVSGYNIYRAAGAASAAATLTFTKINTALNSGVTFIDAGVAAGAAYSYCVTTVDSAGGESACSGVATANVPTNPNAPSAPLITVK
jgi:fibronectin type 3 domain-containing protein